MELHQQISSRTQIFHIDTWTPTWARVVSRTLSSSIQTSSSSSNSQETNMKPARSSLLATQQQWNMQRTIKFWPPTRVISVLHALRAKQHAFIKGQREKSIREPKGKVVYQTASLNSEATTIHQVHKLMHLPHLSDSINPWAQQMKQVTIQIIKHGAANRINAELTNTRCLSPRRKWALTLEAHNSLERNRLWRN